MQEELAEENLAYSSATSQSNLMPVQVQEVEVEDEKSLLDKPESNVKQ
jgi:hypothetical protein